MKKFIIISIVLAGLTVATIYFVNQAKNLKGLTYKIGKPNIIKISSQQIIIDLPVVVTNGSDFNLTVKSSDLTVFVNHISVGRISNNIPQKINKNASTTITAGINFNPSDIFKNVLNASTITELLFDRSKILIKIAGTLDVVIADNLVEKIITISQENTLADLLK